MKILHIFRHGLGDSLQFTSVLRHLQAAHPDWEQDVVCLRGKHSAFAGLVNKVFIDEEPSHSDYAKVYNHSWDECCRSWNDSPSTKTALCLREQFGIIPSWERLSYSLNIGDEARGRVKTYLAGLPIDRGYVVLHYEGNTSQREKNLEHKTAKLVCDYLIHSGYCPIILDWDRRTPLADNKTIWNPDVDNPLWQGWGTGDAETIGALLEGAALFVGIDSGPQKIAFAVGCPTLAVWVGHHPIHYADHTGAVHLVPENHSELIRGERDAGLQFFSQHYAHVPYRNISADVIDWVGRKLYLHTKPAYSFLKAKGYNEDYYNEHAIAGLDYLSYGGWQQRYGRWVMEALGMQGKVILDVGCACGSIAAGMAEAGGYVSGVDLSQHMIDLGRNKWKDFPLFVCDSINLHLWRDSHFDMLHSAQVFEHYKPELVPFILKELLRVTKPGGCLFSTLDTEELFRRQGRLNSPEEDPTHICIKPLDWWYSQALAAGWELAPELLDALKNHHDSFFNLYDWDGFVLRKPC